MPLLQSYAVMLPRLVARESVRQTTETSIGTSLRFERPSQVLKDWGRSADPHRRASVATDQDLADLPIKVTRVPVA